MQPVASASCRNVQQACALGAASVAIRATHEIGEPFRIVVGKCRREQQVLAAARCRPLEPVQWLLVVGRRLAPKAERDHRVELEPLRAMHRHDLDAAPAWRIALRLLCHQRILDTGGVVEIAEPFLLREQREHLLGRTQVLGAIETGWTVERVPRPLDPTRERAPRARGKRGVETRARDFQARAAVVAQPCEALGIAHQIPDHAAPRVVTQRVQVTPREPAPRRVQHREPSDAVGAMRQRPCKPKQVLRDGLLAERVDLDRVHRHASCAEPLAQPRKVSSGLDEHGDRLLGVALELGRDQLGDARALARAASAEDPRADCTALAPSPCASRCSRETRPRRRRSGRLSGTRA